ncbi:ankyrin repeat and SOCS box protein 10 [Alligator mississippiensis]|nr:ankyrin repeat and SOCS box protein 10 [Alligator mississippiensis]
MGSCAQTGGRQPARWYPDPIVTKKAEGPAWAYWQALVEGDVGALSRLLGDPQAALGPNAVFDTSDLEEWKNYRFNFRCLRLWSLTYEQELTTPLHITAGRGYADCLRFLLLRGAAVDFAPSGKTALHEACAAAHTDCARLLLGFGADPQAVSEDGYQPLHLCKSPGSLECARLLLQSGASVSVATEDEEDSPLHVVARHGLPEHVGLLLRYGAAVDAENEEGQMPLHAACAQPHGPEDIERYFEVCQQLVEHGARVDVPDRDLQRPLHLACKVANARVVELLLDHGASVNIMNYSGNTAMHNVLQVAAYKLLHQPERMVRALLNHGAVRVWPGSLTKVLRYCHAAPRVIEALINSYDRVRVSDEWAEAVPPDTLQKHQGFYQSLFALGQQPRSLQHLARCTLRTHLEGRVLLAAPRLGLPPALLRFLLLDFEDVVY